MRWRGTSPNCKISWVAAGLTQQELPDETGVAVMTIALIETKEVSNPSVGTLKRLLAYFKITFEELRRTRIFSSLSA